MEAAYTTLIQRPISGGVNDSFKNRTSKLALDGNEHPRVVSLGGDHTIVSYAYSAFEMMYGVLTYLT